MIGDIPHLAVRRCSESCTVVHQAGWERLWTDERLYLCLMLFQLDRLRCNILRSQPNYLNRLFNNSVGSSVSGVSASESRFDSVNPQHGTRESFCKITSREHNLKCSL